MTAQAQRGTPGCWPAHHGLPRPAASVWVATSDDVPGLVAEAATAEALQDKLRILI